MTNTEFINKYGIKEMIDLFDSINIRLAILKATRKIGKYKIIKRKKMVCFYSERGNQYYEIAKIYSMSDKELINEIYKKD